MSDSITVLDLIRRSMTLISAVAPGETLDDMDANDALMTLNEMLSSWSTETLSVYGEANEDQLTVPGKSVYTWGTGGDWTTIRPVFIDGVTCVRQGVSTPVRIVAQDEYDRIAIKSTSQALIEQFLYVNSYPLGIATLFPVPTEVVTLNIATRRQLTQIAALNNTLSAPPGYLRAIRYCLAVDLWPEYPNSTTDINSIKAIALKAKSNISISNMTDTITTFDLVPNVDSGRSWDWREG